MPSYITKVRSAIADFKNDDCESDLKVRQLSVPLLAVSYALVVGGFAVVTYLTYNYASQLALLGA